MNSILVIGAGGHAKVVISTLRAVGLQIAGILDDAPTTWHTNILGCQVLGGLHLLEPDMSAIIAIGSNHIRQNISKKYEYTDWITAVHPTAFVDSSVTLGSGTIIFAGAVVQPDTRIGQHVIVNTAATVDHDCLIEDFVHIAPGVHLAGDVTVNEGALLGVGCVAKPGTKIGQWTTVGAGGVIINTLPPHVVATGIPAVVKG